MNFLLQFKNVSECCVSFALQVVRQDRALEQIVFPVPPICEFLTAETRQNVFLTVERDEQGSKVADFFSRVDMMFCEMNWQKKLRGKLLAVCQKLAINFMSAGSQ